MFIAFMILGAAWLILAVWAWRANRIFATSVPSSSRWRSLYRFWWAFGLLLGAVSYFVAFPVTSSERYVVHGFPFPAYAFDSAGHDYVGFLTLPFILINFACWFLAVHFCFRLAAPRLSAGIGG